MTGKPEVHKEICEVGVGGGSEGPVVFFTLPGTTSVRVTPDDARDFAKALLDNADTSAKLWEKHGQKK
jgi:hypothetical protein